MAIHRFAAVDLGATSGRVILAAIDGDEIALEEISRFPDPIIEMQGHFYWDLPAIYKSVIEGLGAIAARGVAIESVGIDTWGVDFAMFGRDGALLRLPYCYRDPHTDGAPEKFFERMPCKTLYEKTGIQIMNFNSVFQFDALRRNGCSALEAADKILFIPDALAYMLTGNAVTEYTIASTAQMIDPRTKQWDPDIMNELGLSPEKFGRMTMSGDMIGTLTAEAQRLTGLGAVPVVAVASHDTGSAVAAVPAEDDNFAYLSSGTWSLMGIESKEPIIAERSEPFRSVINPDAPCFANPPSMTEAIADYCRRTGQPVPESVGQYARCIFESLALRYRQVIDMLKTLSPHPIEKLYVIGGGARNEMLNRFTADATGIPVETGSSESTALGNVMMQAKHAGVAGSVAEMRGMIRASLADSRRYEPTDGERWQAAYEMYLRRTGEA